MVAVAGRPPSLRVALLLLPWLVVLGAGPARAQEPACGDEAHRAFDFWVGTWEVRRPDGALAGTNTIRKTMGGCVLHESYDGVSGYHGESFNVYDASRGVWHQTWVDGGGLLLLLEGGVEKGAMVLSGERVDDEGAPILERITWTPLAPEDGRDRVRQHWERSRDGGASWETVFDGTYLRLPDPRSGG